MTVSLLLKQLAQAPPVVLRQPCMPRLDAEHLSLLSPYNSSLRHAKLEQHRCNQNFHRRQAVLSSGDARDHATVSHKLLGTPALRPGLAFSGAASAGSLALRQSPSDPCRCSAQASQPQDGPHPERHKVRSALGRAGTLRTAVFSPGIPPCKQSAERCYSMSSSAFK